MSYLFENSDGERLSAQQADALYNAFRGIRIFAEKIAKKLPDVAANDTDRNLVTTDSIERQQDQRERLPGIRDDLYGEHPIAQYLFSALADKPDAVPEPVDGITTALEKLGCKRIDGVFSLNGVPVPVGAAQITYFVALRFRSLFHPGTDPARVYRGDLAYDAKHVTDEMQESILLVSTRIYKDFLIRVQETEPELFLAMWMRQIERTKLLCTAAPVAHLPACYPRSRLRDRRKCLMIVCDVMNEWERSFDLLESLRFASGVTRSSIRSALNSCTSLTKVYGIDDDTHRHISGAVAHARSIHGSMNPLEPTDSCEPAFAAIAHAFESNKVYGKQYRRVRYVLGEMPVRYFLGVEPMFLLPVALIHMKDSMKKHEGYFWSGKRGKMDGCKGSFATRLMSLAAIATSTICLPTARAMTRDNGERLDSHWIREEISPLISNPVMEEALEKEAARQDQATLHDPDATRATIPSSACGDKEKFKSTHEGAKTRARLCSAPIGKPGWTMGFRPDAWRQPDAEIVFLRKCCKYTLFSQELKELAERWNRPEKASKPVGKTSGRAQKIKPNLPAYHPKMRIEDLFREWFDKLQVADSVRGVTGTYAWRYRETVVQEIAPILAALTAITDDPQLNERFWIDKKAAGVQRIVHGAWNTQ